MDGSQSLLPCGIFGVISLFSGIGTAFVYKNYRKAKRQYENARTLPVLTVKEAALSKPETSTPAFIEGWIEKIDQPDKVLSFNYEKILQIPGFSSKEYYTGKNYSPFYLKDKMGNKVYVAPSDKLRMIKLVRKDDIPLNWFHTLLYAFLNGGIIIGSVEYFAFDGDLITLFGVLSYDIALERATLLPKMVASSGHDDILSDMKHSYSLFSTVMLGILFATTASLAGYFGYRAYQSRRQRQ